MNRPATNPTHAITGDAAMSRRSRGSGLARTILMFAVLGLGTAAFAGEAAAQPARPWAEGVSAEESKAALALFTEGNALLKDGIFPDAARKYREALTHWNHPAIHYNLALALVNLDQPIEMFHALEAAMAYDCKAIDDDKCKQAKNLKSIVEKQLAHVEYTVELAGAKMVFDGKEVFTGPGTWKELIQSGEHSVTVQAKGHVTTQVSAKILGGETDVRTFELFTEDQLLRTKRLMPGFVPFTVGGIGAAIIGGGFFLHQSAKSSFADYDAGIKTCAAADPTGGCTTPPNGLFDKKTSAKTKQTIAMGAYGLGGAALAAGITLFALNRPQTYRVNPKEVAEPGVSLIPVVTPDLTGLAAIGSF